MASLGAVAIALGAQVTVPMVPVPMTLQTLAVVVVGLVGGPWVGAGSALAYLGLVLLGLPVLADGSAHGGVSFFAEPSAGYVLGFVPGAAITGLAAQRMGQGGWGPWGAGALAGLVGHAVVLFVGTVVLARVLGPVDAVIHGCLPFVPGAGVKSGLAAAVAVGVERARRWRSGPPQEP